MTGFPKSQCLIWKMKIIITVPEETAFMPCSSDFTRAGNSACAYNGGWAGPVSLFLRPRVPITREIVWFPQLTCACF